MGKEIGIDFGTTNTVVSYVNKNGKLRHLRYGQDEVIPSAIYFVSRDEYFIGSKALKMLEQNPAAGAVSFKLNIGDNERKTILPEKGAALNLRAREIAKLFLNKIVVGLENKLLKEFGAVDGVIDRTVITVPAKFTSTQKSSTRRAARDAGLKDVKLAAEPTAAAIAYENSTGDENSNAVILVYDFGGGTFDVSIIRRDGNAFEEINTGGDKNLGGNTLTEKLAQEILEKINEDYGAEFPWNKEEFDADYHGISLEEYKKNLHEIRRGANFIKEELSSSKNVAESLNIFLPGGKSELVTIYFSREELEALIGEYIERTVDITIQTIQGAAAKGYEHIDQIVLAGGSSNIPLVKEKLEQRMQSQDVVFDEDVSTLISRGAAILANRYFELESLSKSVTPVQMGIAATEGVQLKKFQMIIPENEQLPCRRKKIFYLSQDNQRRLEIEYYERDIKNYPKAWRVDHEGIEQIDSLVIDNLPPNLKASEVEVEVEFIAQKDGSLDINVELVDNSGAKISSGNMTFNKKSELLE